MMKADAVGRRYRAGNGRGWACVWQADGKGGCRKPPARVKKRPRGTAAGRQRVFSLKRLQQRHKPVGNGTVMSAAYPEVLFLIRPYSPGDVILFKRGVDIGKPAQRTFRIGFVDYAVLPAVQGNVVLLADSNGFGEQASEKCAVNGGVPVSELPVKITAENVLRFPAQRLQVFRIGNRQIRGHVFNPICRLVGKNHRTVAMERKDNIPVIRFVQQTEAVNTAVINSAQNNPDVLIHPADCLHRSFCNPVPGLRGFLRRDFIEKFKGHPFGILAVAPREFLPHPDEIILQRFIRKKAAVIFVVKNIPDCFVQIEDGIQIVLAAPFDTSVDIPESAFNKASVFVLEQVKVYRQSNVVNLPAGDFFNVLFGDERIKPLLCVISFAALRQPSAEIHAFLKAFEFPHRIIPPLYAVINRNRFFQE